MRSSVSPRPPPLGKEELLRLKLNVVAMIAEELTRREHAEK